MSKKSMPTLAHVLTPFPHHIDKQAAIADAEAMMLEHDIRHLIVMNDGDIDGLLSERDIQKHTGLGQNNRDGLTVSDICVNTVVVADIHDPLDKILDAMAEQHLGSVVVLKNGELSGIFTNIDACKSFSIYLKEQFQPDTPPDMIA